MSTIEDRIEKNLFDIEESFFVIDSENLNNVKEKLYGFCLQEDKIIEDKDFQKGVTPNFNGCGTYVCVQKSKNTIRIHQDFNGSYGIYIYRDNEYFALSNSFLRLVDYVKTNHKITINVDYTKHFVVSGLCSIAYSDTMINEIEMLEKNVVLVIDISDKVLNLSYINYGENTLELDSSEGIKTLDRWYNKWTSILRIIKAESNNIQIALSGGFDSRLTFMLALKSGINLDEVKIYSINDELHTHAEDYEIASQIADHYHFRLNSETLETEGQNYTLEDIINISFYTKLTFHKQMYYKNKHFNNRRFLIGGAGGECVRSYWNFTQEEFKEWGLKSSSVFSYSIAEDLKLSGRRIIDTGFKKIEKKYNLNDSQSTDFSLNLYRDTRCRNHFGKGTVEDFFANQFTLCPLMDPELHKLRLSDSVCKDKNLLMALIYVRYCRELLDFKFEGDRSINVETIKYAEAINKKYPFNEKENYQISKVVCKDTKFDACDLGISCSQNKLVSTEDITKYIKRLYKSSKFRYTFSTLLNDEIYRFALNYIETTNYHPLQNCYMVIAITKILADVYANEDRDIKSLNDFFVNYSQRNDELILSEAETVLDKLNNYITARFDAKIMDSDNSDLELIHISDVNAKVRKPEWYQKNGTGYVIESNNLCVDMEFRCITSGKFRITLRGRAVCDEQNNRIPYWIDYKILQCNGKTVFDCVTPVWHDKPFIYECTVNAGDEIYIHAEWGFHCAEQNSEDEIQKLNVQITKFKKVKEIKNSITYRVGRVIMYLSIKLKKIFNG